MPKARPMSVHVPATMTKEAFLDWVETVEERCEYAGGRAILLPRINLGHALVSGNLLVALSQRLDPHRFDVMGPTFAVHVGNSVRLPDVMVEFAQEDGQALQAEAPLLIAEVISPETRHFDFGEKRQEYLGLPSLQAYLIVSPDEPQIWIWRRADSGFDPEPEIVEGRDRIVALPALAIEIPVAEIYRGIR
jgi:Uma2 family endonuclease